MSAARVALSGVVLTLLLLASEFSTAKEGSTPPPAASSDPCLTPQQQEFQFWVGDWDLTWPGAKAGTTDHGTNHITRVLGGCVVHEDFSGGDAMHLRGASVSSFDRRTGKWKQTWVDNEGGYLDFVGEFKDGQMVLSREGGRPDGTKVLQRMVWKNIQPDQLDWSWEFSTDGGKDWSVQWPIHYRRRSSSGPSAK